VTAHAAVWWIVVVLLVAILVATGMQLARAFRSLRNIMTRAGELEDLPAMRALAGVERDLERINAAADALRPLVARAAAAAEVIRKGPLPPELPAAIARVRVEIAAFRRFARP